MKSRWKLRRTWTAAAADGWTKEDVVACTLGVCSFVGIALGTPYCFLLQPIGFLILGVGLALGALGLWIIGPKLDAVSSDYEEKQHRYLEELERMMRWEERDG